MYGARRATSRSVGVLKACFNLIEVGNSFPLPVSFPRATPMSWKELSVNSQPLWQEMQGFEASGVNADGDALVTGLLQINRHLRQQIGRKVVNAIIAVIFQNGKRDALPGA